MSTEPTGVETHEFKAEVNRVLSLVINSLYSHPEVFLRELVSNASDALDRLRYRAVTDHGLLKDSPPARVRLIPDEASGTLTIEDTGVGMTHDDLLENLGTVARSGTQRFISALEQKAEQAKDGGDVNLIGQFGVGFYSGFLVADRVDVITRAAGSDEAAWRWSSDGQESFSLEPAERAFHGTSVTLHLGDDHKEFLQPWQLKRLVERYSDYIDHPIELRVEPLPAPEDADADADADEDAPAAEPVVEWEQINKANALWQRPKTELSDEDYDAFYQHLTRDFEAPATRTHFKVEGTRLFTGLLFVPGRPPFDLFSPQAAHGVRLYVKRVFIMDDCEELLPRWLRFVRGVVDSDDLPLNVSREILQDSAVVRFIQKQVTKKCLDMLDRLAKDDAEAYAKVWEAYGVVLKEGVHLAFEHRERLARLLRFRSSAEAGWVSLDTYVDRMPEEQEAIYIVLGTSLAAAAASPHLEALRKRGYEILYLTDPIDEWVVSGLREHRDKKLVSAMKADLDLGGEEGGDDEAPSDGLASLITRFEGELADQVGSVRTSNRLTTSAACLVVPEGGLHAHVERLLRASEHAPDVPGTRRILELNPAHPVVERLAELNTADGESDDVARWIHLVHDQALLAEGSPIRDPAGFATRLSQLMGAALGVTVPEPEVVMPTAPAAEDAATADPEPSDDDAVAAPAS